MTSKLPFPKPSTVPQTSLMPILSLFIDDYTNKAVSPTDHLIAKINWQSDYWQDAPTDDDVLHSGHGYVKAGNLPHEPWNFNMHKHTVDGYKIGFFQATNPPAKYPNGSGIAFFESRDHIVGLYGKAELGNFKVDGDFTGNLWAPIDFCVCWSNANISSLPVDKERYYMDKERVGQIGFTYIGDDQARNIITDAMSANEDSPEVVEQLREVAAVVWPSPLPTGKHYFVETKFHTSI